MHTHTARSADNFRNSFAVCSLHENLGVLHPGRYTLCPIRKIFQSGGGEYIQTHCRSKTPASTCSRCLYQAYTQGRFLVGLPTV